MSDQFENMDISNLSESNPENHSESNLEEFIPEMSNFEVPDPSTVVTIRTSGGQDRFIPVDGSMTVNELLANSDIRIVGEAQYWLNGAMISRNDLVPAGSTLTIIGTVKGG